ncbi:hypothetical protein D3C80_2082660 [compost metagenome]
MLRYLTTANDVERQKSRSPKLTLLQESNRRSCRRLILHDNMLQCAAERCLYSSLDSLRHSHKLGNRTMHPADPAACTS